MASNIKLKNLENTEFEITHNDGEGAISVTSSQLKNSIEIKTLNDIGWTGAKTDIELVYQALIAGDKFKMPLQITNLNKQFAKWSYGSKAPICFYGDSTVDGTATTINGVDYATEFNFNLVDVDGNVPDGFNNDHGDDEVPNAFPNILQRLIRSYNAINASNLCRVYNAGFRNRQVVNGWAGDNIYNAVYNNPEYSDVEWIGFLFGINDSEARSGEDLKHETYFRYKALILDAFERGVQPALLSTTPTGQTSNTESDYSHNTEVLNIVNNVKKQLCQEFNIEYIDIHTMLIDFAYSNNDNYVLLNESLDDGIHFSDIGHLKIAEYILMQSSGNSIPLVNKDRRFAVADSSVRYSLPIATISGTDYYKDINKKAENALISSTILNSNLNTNIVDLWIYNTMPNASIEIASCMFGVSKNYSGGSLSEYPQIRLYSQVGTALSYYLNTEFNNADPNLIGEGGANLNSDSGMLLGKLSYGLNILRVYIPSTINSVFDSYGYQLNYFNIVAEDSRISHKYSQYDLGVNLENVAQWRNVLKNTGTLFLTNIDLDPLSAGTLNSQFSYIDYDKNRNNGLLLSQTNDITEFEVLMPDERDCGVVLSHMNANTSILLSTENENNINFGSTVFYNDNSSIYYKLGYISAGGSVLYHTTSLEFSTYSNTYLRLKFKREFLNIVFTVTDLNGTVLYTITLNDSTQTFRRIIGGLKGCSGGLWVSGGAVNLTKPVSLSHFKMRTYKE